MAALLLVVFALADTVNKSGWKLDFQSQTFSKTSCFKEKRKLEINLRWCTASQPCKISKWLFFIFSTKAHLKVNTSCLTRYVFIYIFCFLQITTLSNFYNVLVSVKSRQLLMLTPSLKIAQWQANNCDCNPKDWQIKQFRSGKPNIVNLMQCYLQSNSEAWWSELPWSMPKAEGLLIMVHCQLNLHFDPKQMDSVIVFSIN